MFTCTAGSNSTGMASVASRCVRIVTNSCSVTPSRTWMLPARSAATVVSKVAVRPAGG